MNKLMLDLLRGCFLLFTFTFSKQGIFN